MTTRVRLGLLRLALVGALALSTACLPKTGTMQTSSDSTSPIVSISAGTAPVGKAELYANYLIDRATRTCFFATFNAMAEVSCCRLAQGLPEADAVIGWLNAASCMAPVTTP